MKNQRFLCSIISGSSVFILLSIVFVVLSFGEESQSPIQNLSTMRQPSPTPQPYNTNIFTRWSYDPIASRTPTPVYIASGGSTPTPTPTTLHHGLPNAPSAPYGHMHNAINLPDEQTGMIHYYGPGEAQNSDDWTGNKIFEYLQQVRSKWLTWPYPWNFEPIEFGDVSKQGDANQQGGYWYPPHRSHQNGLDIDLHYCSSQSSTQKLIDYFEETGQIQYIFVKPNSGLTGPHVQPEDGHDNHFHVRFVDPDGTSN